MDGTIHLGVVAAFDEPRGLGEVTDDRTGTPFPFHCTRIADGTRTVEVGSAVAFCVAAGHLGRMQAVELTKLT